MTSNGLAQCCAQGSLHEGEAKGELKMVGDISTYFAFPKEKAATDKAILILSDVLGHKFPNVQLLADQFAANGYLTVVPDLFYGDDVPLNRPEGFQIMEWLKNHMPKHVEPIIDTVLTELKTKHGVKKVGGIGYCFGGKYVARYLKPGKIDVGYTAHPTMMEPDELRAIEGPLSISAAVRDFVFTHEKRHLSEEILDKLEVPWQLNIFSHVEHGFSVRCDLKDPRQKFAKEQAFTQAVAWFNEYLKA